MIAGKDDIILSTHSLHVGYKQDSTNRLFESLLLQLYKGELVCFMGPNGIGKSTLIRTLAGLQQPLGGVVSIHSNEPSVSKNISVVLADKISTVNLSAYELVSFGRYPYLNWQASLSDNDKRIIDEAFEQTHIQHLKLKKVHSLSDGQLQMVMIARAITQDTPIILLDEPTAHLDLNNRVEIMKLLRQIARATKKSILVSTHELDLALQLADRIWLASTNKTIISGFPEDLVLDGSFDRIFQFKGFDLKTGKVIHEVNPDKKVELIGSGPEFLWTKNALERNGFSLGNDCEIKITVVSFDNKLMWEIQNGSTREQVSTLQSLIDKL